MATSPVSTTTNQQNNDSLFFYSKTNMERFQTMLEDTNYELQDM